MPNRSREEVVFTAGHMWDVEGLEPEGFVAKIGSTIEDVFIDLMVIIIKRCLKQLIEVFWYSSVGKR